jgi:CxxC-x17-CxxC domain-containing protein
MSFEDRILECMDCGASFTWTAGEQRFFEEKGFTNEPRRCADCRARKKAARASGEAEGEGRPRRPTGRPGGRPAGAPGRGGPDGGTERRTRELNDFTCASCGTGAKLPFASFGSEPVYCIDCYSGRVPVTRKARTRKEAQEGAEGKEEAGASTTTAEAPTEVTLEAPAEETAEAHAEETAEAPAEEQPQESP